MPRFYINSIRKLNCTSFRGLTTLSSGKFSLKNPPQSLFYFKKNGCQRKLGASLSASYRNFHSSSKLLIQDPYKVLGVDKSSSSSDIKKAYYKLAKQYHPDINKEEGADKKFHDIQDAYEILSNPEKKQQFDQFGSAAFDGSFGAGGQQGGNPFQGGGNPFGGAGNPFGGINFEDIFASAFEQAGRGGGRSRGGGASYVQSYQGEDIEILKTISFKESIFGTNANIDYNVYDSCDSCDGTGLKKGKKKSTCHTCNGTGQTVHFLQAGFQMASTCKTCEGTGVIINPEDSCASCHGEGVVNHKKETQIQFPMGIKDGTRLRVPGEGDAPHVTKGPNIRVLKGDLIVRVRVKPDPKFKRENNDLIYTCDIPMTTAALGGQVEIPTLDDEVFKLKVPSGLQNGRVINVPDKGVPIRNSLNNRGLLKVVFNVKINRPENSTQQALLEALAHTFNDKTANIDPSWKPFTGMEEGSSTNSDSVDSKSTVEDKKNYGDSKLKKVEDFFKSLFNKK
ncbi:hypothetical protein PACTADRAFT_49073 [Pachysolen tannophilus NRRL Y-2460]|uniref:DnaJ homolog 1, mitochondrial n=1 Tax=Pachysolen tannophilus NRRL Y-2460 TaxID=669874 RepID=A0A1E4TZZ8_PACTA|nr:hypothetical protein PACTADRAFT_49073 [Pachysolen tannophilus NRRL Y-2460]